MSKQITFTYSNKEYILEYTRDTVRQMERRGFIADDLATKPMTVMPDLFAGAFLKHHPTVKRTTIDKIYRELGGKSELLEALIAMYNEPIESLLAEPEEGKNVEWTPNWNMKAEDE